VEPGQEVLLPGIGDVTEPVIDESSRVLPRYPEVARRAGVEGQVILQAVIRADGSVGSLLVLRETPSRIGFGSAALEAVSKWRYRPGTQRGRAVTVQVTITVQFTLSR
jgi:protein TonB